MGAMFVLCPFAIIRQLRVGQESATFVRLGQSRHVADLRLIFSVALIIMILSAVLALAFCFEHQIISNWKDVHERQSAAWIWVRLALAAVAGSGAFIGAVGAVSLFESGPDAGRPHPIDGELPADTSRFTSQESYFPVFEASVKELQALEADVVKHVTAFYTYMKVMRDSLRRLAEIKAPGPNGPREGDWHRAICNVVYMQFLGLESGRKAIKDLVEFEPTQAEDMVTILLSELVAYGFLRQQFRGDLRQRRLEARDESYRRDIPALNRLVMAATGPEWDTAKDLAAEMMKRFDLVLVDTPTQRAFRVAGRLPASVA
jgi:hypothetical protein